MVVTASKIEEPINRTSASIEVITRKDIEEKIDERVDETLRGISGLKVLGYGGINPWSWVLIRGSDADHVLVLVDGMEINDPYDDTARLGNIQTDSIERIEVLKGSHSAIYGSEAIGGVINIITKEGKDKAESDISFRGGNYETYKESLFHSGKKKEISYSIGLSRLDAGGSIYTGRFSGNTLSGKIKFPVGDYSVLQFNSFYYDHDMRNDTLCCEFDNNSNLRFTLPDSSVNRESTWINSLQLSQYLKDWWDYRIQVSRYDFNNTWKLEGDSSLPYPLKIDNKGTNSRDVVEIQNNLYPHEKDTLTIGLQYRGEKVLYDEFSNTGSMGMKPPEKQPSINSSRVSRAVYFQNLFNYKNLTFTAGMRMEDGPGFDKELIPRASAAYLFPSANTRIKGGYGKGIKAASIRHLYDPVGGNRDLKPEKSESYEISVEQRINRFRLEVTYFYTALKDLIEWSTNPDKIKFVNIGSAHTKGVEAEVYGADILDSLDIRLGYTYLETRDEIRDKPLRYRPTSSIFTDIRYRGIDRLTLIIASEIAGEFYDPYPFLKDFDGNNLPEIMPVYKVVNIAASYKPRHPSFKNVELDLKINNLFNETYNEIKGFNSLGMNFLGGIKVGF
ncbi:MAG: TonB-dependent receptor [Nitrospinae bacterium]|nr:TonB-dependent receptor [Nitrospinota bacterium]